MSSLLASSTGLLTGRSILVLDATINSRCRLLASLEALEMQQIITGSGQSIIARRKPFKNIRQPSKRGMLTDRGRLRPRRILR